MINSVLSSEFKIKDIEGIGIGSIGPLDPERGAIISSPNMPFKSISLIEPIKRKYNVPTFLLNDCTTAAIGEKEYGAGKEVDNLVYVTLSTGIGGGAYVDDHLLLGKDRNAVEIGHFTVESVGRLQCGCGKWGHWEAYCSGENIPKFVKMLLEEKKEEKNESLLMKLAEGNKNGITTKMLYKAANTGDKLSLEMVQNIGRINAIGFGNVINAYDPSIITVGGTITLKNPDLILKPIKRHVEDYTINRMPNIRITPLRDNAVLYGALALVFNCPF